MLLLVASLVVQLAGPALAQRAAQAAPGQAATQAPGPSDAAVAVAEPAPGQTEAAAEPGQPAEPGEPEPQPAPTGPVTVTATPSKTEVAFGEVFTLELSASGPPGTTYEFVREARHDLFELRTPERPAVGGAAPLPAQVHRYEVVVYALSKAGIPAIPVRYRLPDGTTGEAASAPFEVSVVSLLPKDAQQQKLVDIRGPQPVAAVDLRTVAEDAIAAAFWFALAALLAVVLVWLVRRRRKRESAVATAAAPVVPPDVEARRALDALAASSLLAAGEHRAFYIELTAIAKRYLERRLGAPVLEMTTAETLAFLRGHPLGNDLLTTVRDVADSADRIKFAKGAGLTAEAERHLGSVRELVSTIEARLAPPLPGKEQAA